MDTKARVHALEHRVHELEKHAHETGPKKQHVDNSRYSREERPGGYPQDGLLPNLANEPRPPSPTGYDNPQAKWVCSPWSLAVVAATGLQRADVTGPGADPYVIVSFTGEQHAVNNSLVHELVHGYEDPTMVLRTPVSSGLSPTWSNGNTCLLSRPFRQEKPNDSSCVSMRQRWSAPSDIISFTVKDHDTFGKDDIMGTASVASRDLWKRAFRVHAEGGSEFSEELQLSDQWNYAVGKLIVVFKWC